jgi:hypothetical protein
MTTSALQLRSIPAVETCTPGTIPQNRRRRIDPLSGRALEILGHAIEYLADEYAFSGGPLSADHPVVEAMQILKARNREIYLACPVIPTLAERWRLLWRRTAA